MANYFTDRVVEYPGRVIMTPVQGEANTYDMSRAEGNVTIAGTPFNAETFNDIADDIIQDADDNIITSNELQTIATALGVTPEKLYDILDNLVTRFKVVETRSKVVDSGGALLGETPANSYKDFGPYSFNETFTSQPTVVVSFLSTSTSPTMGSFQVSAIDVTASSFKIRVFNNTSSARSPAIRWMAVGL